MNVNRISFYGIPTQIQADENWQPVRGDSDSYQRVTASISAVFQSLERGGAFVVYGCMGPSAYESSPFLLQEPVSGCEVYGWRPGDPRRRAVPVYAFVLGARCSQERPEGHVYFTLATDVTENPNLSIRTFQPSSQDRRVFMSSHRVFSEYLHDAFPPYPNRRPAEGVLIDADGTPVSLEALPRRVAEESSIKEIAVSRLLEIPVTTILSDNRELCHSIGVDIYNHYKHQAGEDPAAGFAALLEVHDQVAQRVRSLPISLQYELHRGRARSIEHAWDGIGEDLYQWMS